MMIIRWDSGIAQGRVRDGRGDKNSDLRLFYTMEKGFWHKACAIKEGLTGTIDTSDF
jgi:hypothetical protein